MSETVSNQKQINIPQSFEKLGIGLPPMLLEMAGYKGNARFVGLNYYGSKATWHDGRGAATFSYFSVYAPFIDHPAIAVHLRGANADLGSDDSQPTHSLILDREGNAIFLGRGSEVSRFLAGQHPPVEPVEMTDEMWAELEKTFTEQMSDLSNMQFFGMFEMFGADASRQAETQNLINWLNENTPAEIREQFAGFGVRF